MQRPAGGYRELEVYHRSMEAMVEVHRLAAKLPEIERYDLAS